MPVTELHKKKFKKNIAVLAAVVGFMAIVFFVTMIRLQAGMEAGMAERQKAAETQAETGAEAAE